MNCNADSAKLSKKQFAKRLIVLAICVLFIAFSFLSTLFITTHIHHDHKGTEGSCATCAHLATFENLLKHLSIVMACAALAFGCFSAIHPILKPAVLCLGLFTLVHLKVRYNN